MRLIICVFLLGCGTKSGPPPVHTPPDSPAKVTAAFDVGDLKFAWPAPARVTVVEVAVKKGKRARMQYVLEIEPADDKLHVSYRDFKFLEMAGVDLKDPANAEQLAQIEAISGAIPTLVISAQGELLDLRGFDQTMERMLELVLRTVPPEGHAALRKMMTSPELRASVEKKAGDPWRSWVEVWTNADLPAAHESADFEEDDGTPIVFENGGMQPDGTLRLEMRRSRKVPVGEVGALLGDFGDAVEDALTDITMSSYAWVETIPTMQPRRAHLETTIEAVGANGEKKSRFQSHDYTFTW